MHYVNVTLAQHVNNRNVAGVQQWLADRQPHQIADEIARSDEITAILLFRSLDKDRAIEVFEALSVGDQQSILLGLRGQAFRELVEAIGPNDRARLMREAPATVAQRVLAGLSIRERMMTAALLGYPEGSAGRIMSPEIVLVRQDMTAADALETVRAKGGGAETVYTLPVADDARHLMGVVNLRDLVLASPSASVATIAATDTPKVRATDDAETAARLMQDANLIDLPVVDSENRVVGLLTIDDAVATIEAADTEDIARQSAAEPLTGHYMGVRVVQLARARVIWLLLLIVAATLTVSVLDRFEGELATLTQLALFVPLLSALAEMSVRRPRRPWCGRWRSAKCVRRTFSRLPGGNVGWGCYLGRRWPSWRSPSECCGSAGATWPSRWRWRWSRSACGRPSSARACRCWPSESASTRR